ncbi:hypothetical protein WMY93_005706 [Mugilogobius chulae]|uniref:THAP-type domain-containing protein n=1 Tax=Mugilogobius chulae TaxID=88201 RepID=A0AAW0PM45_9GOBI
MCFRLCKRGHIIYPAERRKATRKVVDANIWKPTTRSAEKSFVCERHFSEDSFQNFGLFKSGFTSKLILQPGAVPTIRGADEPAEAPTYTPRATILDAPTPSPCPTAPSKSTRTVSTQLSAGTLKLHHVRSRGVQATTDTSDSCTETETSWLQLSSTPMKATTSGIVDRPRKRPRLEIEEEEEEDLDISDISLPQPHDSTYEPGASLTEVSEMTEMDTAEDFEDTKYIVFESCLKKLFQTCPICKQHCNLQRRRFGTFVSFTQNCPHCLYHRKWDSQPIMESTPVGNLQLSAAVYFSGASFVKMEKICKAMKLQVHQYDTFRRHSRLFLEPAIYHKWKTDQQLFLEELKKKDKIAVGGDMRADSPGHSAKFGSYTLMELESEKILDIQLVQSNEVGGSFYMEKEGLRRSLDLLQDNNINLDYIVTDRHTQVKTFLRGRNITQYYDVWHMEKGLSKKLDKLSKDKECQLIKKWSAAIKNHMYWAASSSKTGPEKVAKWTSLINHIQNVHTHDDPEFPKCAHPEKVSRDPSKWFQPGSLALYKVEKLLVNKRVLGDVSKLSSDHQTSSLEAFHSVVIRFAPKSVVFPFVGMMCRLYLAGMHFNENVKRAQATSKGKVLFKVAYPKYKKGKPTAKPVKTKPTFGYVTELMRLVFNEVFAEPGRFVDQLKSVPVPEDLSAQHEKVSKDEVIAAHVSRFSRAVGGPDQGTETQHTAHQDPETPGVSGVQRMME